MSLLWCPSGQVSCLLLTKYAFASRSQANTSPTVGKASGGNQQAQGGQCGTDVNPRVSLCKEKQRGTTDNPRGGWDAKQECHTLPNPHHPLTPNFPGRASSRQAGRVPGEGIRGLLWRCGSGLGRMRTICMCHAKLLSHLPASWLPSPRNRVRSTAVPPRASYGGRDIKASEMLPCQGGCLHVCLDVQN